MVGGVCTLVTGERDGRRLVSAPNPLTSTKDSLSASVVWGTSNPSLCYRVLLFNFIDMDE